MTLFIAAVFEIAGKKRKPPTSVGEWINKLWYIYILYHAQ